MKFAVIDNGVVTNMVIADAALEANWVQTDEAGMGWLYDGSTFAEPLPYLPTQQEQSDLRAAAYNAEADPLFFMSQRGEATVEEWQTKVAEIKARFPYPEA
jgi:hypothetical protein